MGKAKSKLEEQETELGLYLQVVYAIPPTVRGIPRALRFSALQKMTAQIRRELAMKEKLEADFENLLTRFVARDDQVRRRVILHQLMTPPPLDAALPSRRPQRPIAPATRSRSTSSHDRALLVKRILTVDEFHQEMLDRWHKRSPATAPKAIPVPLNPGESIEQYTGNFQQWLTDQGEDFARVHQDISRTRSLWHSFAHYRAKMFNTMGMEKQPQPRAPKRGIDEEYDEFYQRSPPQELKRARRGRSMERARSPTREAPRAKDKGTSSSLSSGHSSNFAESEMNHVVYLNSRSRPSGRCADFKMSLHEMPPRTTHHKPEPLAPHSTHQRSASPSSHSDRGHPVKPLQPKSRTEILAPRVLALDEYLQELKLPKHKRTPRRPDEKLSKIPVPLFPGETMDDYDQAFGRWLHQRRTSVLSLRSDPLKERVYRHQFAQQRARKKLRETNNQCSRYRMRSQSPASRTRYEHPESRKPSSEMRSNAYGYHSHHSDGRPKALSPTSSQTTSHHPIDPVVSKDLERHALHESHFSSSEISRISTANYDQNSEKESTRKHSDTNSEKHSQNGDHESTSGCLGVNADQQDQMINEHKAQHGHSDTSSDASTRYMSTPATTHDKCTPITTGVDEVDLTPAKTAPTRSSEDPTTPRNLSTSDQESDIYASHTEEKLPSWASQLMSRVQQLEAEVTELKKEVGLCRAGTCCHTRTGKACSEESDLNGVLAVSLVDSGPAKAFSAEATPNLTNEVTDHPVCSRRGNANSKFSRDPGKKMADINADSQQPVPFSQVDNAITRKYVAQDILQNAEGIYTEASRNLAGAIQTRVKEDPKKRQLTEAYDHLNQQIEMNETAIDDALAYVKAIKDVDEAVATEQHGQIMELIVSINKEKERRACALAELIRYNWTRSKDALLTLLEEQPSQEHRMEATHEKLSTISSQIEQQDGVLETLEIHLNEQLQWVTGISADIPEAGKALRFKALRKLSKRLTKEQAAKEKLEREREEVMIHFLQGDEDIRKLMMDSL